MKPHLKEEWNTEKWNWFCSEDTETLVEFRGEFITKKQYDRRTPGKFKEEYQGIGMACLKSKTYIIWKTPEGEEFKLSSKSVQERRNTLTPQDFINTLSTQVPKIIENTGLIRGKKVLFRLIHNKNREFLIITVKEKFNTFSRCLN